MSTSQIPCPGCKKTLLVANFTAAKRLRCPWCRAEFTALPSAAQPAQRVPSPLAPVTPVRPSANAGAPPAKGAKWGIAILCAVVLMGCAAAAAAWHFSAKKPQEQASNTPENPDPGASTGGTGAPQVLPTPADPPSGNPPADPPQPVGTVRPPSRYVPPTPVDPPDPPMPPKDPVDPPPMPMNPPPVNPPPLVPADPPMGNGKLTPEKQKKVNEAIDRGVAWLKKAVDQDLEVEGWTVGSRALPGLTLLECGVPANDPHVQKLARVVRQNLSRTDKTYDLSLAILFLDRLGEAQDRPLIQHLALQLIAGQTIHGGWEYTASQLSAVEARQLSAVLQKLQPRTDKELAALLIDNAPKDPPKNNQAEQPVYWARPATMEINRIPAVELQPGRQPFKGVDGSDNSNTQFALLALWAARRHGVPVDRALALIVQRFYWEQQEDGGWTYYHTTNVHDTSTDTMTCAGLLGLAIGHALASQDQKIARENTRINRGLSRLSTALRSASGNEDELSRNLYFIWSVERVGVLFNLDTISGVDWYAWSADRLASTQTGDGCWALGGFAGSVELIDTSFALLVLRRADLAKDLSRKLEMLIEVKDLK